MFGLNLNMDARVEVNVEASPKDVDVMLMTADDLAQFKQARGKLFGGKYTYRQALSRQATLKMQQTEVLPLGSWAIVVQRPQEAIIFGDETTVSADVTVYQLRWNRRDRVQSARQLSFRPVGDCGQALPISPT